MIILHAAFSANEFLLWGETRNESGRQQPGYSPYDAGVAALTESLAPLGITFKKTERMVREAVAWLPTLANTPLVSSPLLSQESAHDGSPSLHPWIVTALALDPSRRETLLAFCAGKQLSGQKTLSPGVIIGEDLAFWAAAMRFAASLVARQQFLPDLALRSKSFQTFWKPVIVGEDIRQLRDLATAMPASARALAATEISPPSVPAESVLSDFIADAVDNLVRFRGAVKLPAQFDSLHDQWLHALRSGAGNMDGPAAQLQALAAQVREWQRPIQVSSEAPFRLCFRLEEPEKQDGSWQVRYLLQGTNDPSLILPAQAAWTGNGARGAKSPLKKLGAVKEHLLISLGQAAAVCPRIEASLREPAPTGYEVDTPGACEFLTTRAGALEQSGFGVMLPSWWSGRGARQRLSARASVKTPKMQGGSGLSLETIVQFNWQVALGDETISLGELQALAALKVPLVKIRGQWVEANAEEIQAAIDFLKRKSNDAGTVRDAVRMAIGAAVPAGPLEITGVQAEGWVADLLGQLEGRASFEELPPPAGFTGLLRPYQTRGYSWLAFLKRWGLGACLADDMGLGKTVQTLTLIQHSWHALNSADGERPVLLICPTSVVGNWQKEAARFTPNLPVLVHHGVSRAKGQAFQEQARKHAIVLSSYALLHRDFEILKAIPWAAVILDEAQNIKNPETKQARAARSLPAGYRIALTGTPVENNVGDLWSIMEFLNPGFLGNQSDFRKRYFVPIQLYGDQNAGERLKRVTGPFILRRLKTDKSIIADLPDKLEMKVFCTLTREQASLYAAVVKDAEEAIANAEGIQRKGVVLATLSKLKQVCNHPAQFLKDNSGIAGRSGKLARLTEMLEEALAVGDRALVFTQFAEMGMLLRSHLQETFGAEVLFLHGAVSKKQRDTMVERFGAQDGPRIFLLSLKAGGTGLNLTGANHVFHFDRWWNPAVENQATDRAFRIGQNRNVQVHKFICAGTLEDKIDEMIERKKEVAGRVVGTGEGWLTELSNVELKNLFALNQNAIGE